MFFIDDCCVIFVICASINLDLKLSISNAAIVYIFFKVIGDAFNPFKSSAIFINILAASVCRWAFRYNSTRPIFFPFSNNILPNLLTRPSIWKKLFFSANSTAKFHLFINTQVSMAFFTSPYLK